MGLLIVLGTRPQHRVVVELEDVLFLQRDLHSLDCFVYWRYSFTVCEREHARHPFIQVLCEQVLDAVVDVLRGR